MMRMKDRLTPTSHGDHAPHRRHTDIDPRGWWRRLPRQLHPYILVARFDRPIGWWLLLLPGWWIIPAATGDTGRMVELMLLFLVGAVTTRAAGCVINDLWDRRLDRRVERTAGRPLAAGTMSVGAALAFLAALGLIGLAVLVRLPGAAIITGIAALPLVILYPLAKRVTWWPQAVLGLTFSWGVPLGWAAAGMESAPALPPPALLAVYLGSVAWVFGYDTIYAVQDMEDDRAAGVKSSALGLGRHLQGRRVGRLCPRHSRAWWRLLAAGRVGAMAWRAGIHGDSSVLAVAASAGG
jgi:4-hydroxybenzoate polyprenyltransferase